MPHYYETSTKGEIQSHETLEQAIEFANANNCEIISEIGGNWEEFQKCWFCDDWFISTELIGTGVCARCDRAIADHS